MVFIYSILGEWEILYCLSDILEYILDRMLVCEIICRVVLIEVLFNDEPGRREVLSRGENDCIKRHSKDRLDT